MSEDWAAAEPVEAAFEVQLPIAEDVEPTVVAHMSGDESVFLERLRALLASDRSEAATLATPIAVSISGPEVDAAWAILDSLGGATVRSIVPI